MVNLEVRDKISISDQEVTDYFEQHREEFRVEESFTVQEIVLTQDVNRDFSTSLGATVIEESKAGTPFNELVVKYSQAPSRFKDGMMGPLKRGDLSSGIENAALALQPGGVSEPIRTKAGLHIIRLESHTLAKDPNLVDARAHITSTLKQQKFIAALTEYFKKLMESNLIEINSNYKQYDQRS